MKIKITIGILFFCTLLYMPKVNATTNFNNSTERLVLTLLAPNIQTQINEYYKLKLNHSPTFAPYLGGNILEFTYQNSGVEVVVTVVPYVGPHLSVGKDRMKFEINNDGKIKVVNYKHLEDYKIPPTYIRN